MTLELAGPFNSGNDVEPFHSEKDCYILLPVDGALIFKRQFFEESVLRIFENKIARVKFLHSSELNLGPR